MMKDVLRTSSGSKKTQRVLTPSSSSSSTQRKGTSIRERVPKLPGVLIAVLCSAILVLAKWAWKINDMNNNNSIPVRISYGTGVGERLNNFVETRGRSMKGLQKNRTVAQYPKTQSLPSVDSLVDRSHRIELPDHNRSLAFVHIGKSGGSTISLLLRNGCVGAADGKPCEEERWTKVPGSPGLRIETPASKRIKFYLHVAHVESGKMAEYYSRVNSVVVVARDPFDRFVSAFLSRHPKNMDAVRVRNLRLRDQALMLGEEPPVWAKPTWGSGNPMEDQIHRAAYDGCYPSLETFSLCASPTPPAYLDKVYQAKIEWVKKGTHQKQIGINCTKICKDVILGRNNYIQHLECNYEAFLKDLPSATEVFVIRTKSLWRDWRELNKILGKEKKEVDIPDEGSRSEVVNARGKLPVKARISEKGKSIICMLLKDEIKIYIALINRAVNLSDEDVKVALEGVQKNCPSVIYWLNAEDKAKRD